MTDIQKRTFPGSLTRAEAVEKLGKSYELYVSSTGGGCENKTAWWCESATKTMVISNHYTMRPYLSTSSIDNEPFFRCGYPDFDIYMMLCDIARNGRECIERLVVVKPVIAFFGILKCDTFENLVSMSVSTVASGYTTDVHTRGILRDCLPSTLQRLDFSLEMETTQQELLERGLDWHLPVSLRMLSVEMPVSCTREVCMVFDHIGKLANLHELDMILRVPQTGYTPDLPHNAMSDTFKRALSGLISLAKVTLLVPTGNFHFDLRPMVSHGKITELRTNSPMALSLSGIGHSNCVITKYDNSENRFRTSYADYGSALSAFGYMMPFLTSFGNINLSEISLYTPASMVAHLAGPVPVGLPGAVLKHAHPVLAGLQNVFEKMIQNRIRLAYWRKACITSRVLHMPDRVMTVKLDSSAVLVSGKSMLSDSIMSLIPVIESYVRDFKDIANVPCTSFHKLCSDEKAPFYRLLPMYQQYVVYEPHGLTWDQFHTIGRNVHTCQSRRRQR